MYRSFLKAYCVGLLGSVILLGASDGLCQEPTIPPLPSEPVPAPLPPDALTTAQLERMAEDHNPTLAQAARRIQALQGEQIQVGLRPNPMIGYLGEEMGDSGTAGQQGMVVGKRFITAGKLDLNRNVVGHEIEQARQVLEMQRRRVLNDVRSRAYDVLIAQRTVELNRQLVEIGNAAVTAAESLYQAKEVSRVDVLQARVEANSAKLQLSNAQNDHVAAWRQLCMVVGIPEMQMAPLTDEGAVEPADVTWQQAAERLLAESPELARAWAGVERAKCALARAQAGRTPDLDMEASVRYNNSSRSTTATIGVGIPLQVFDRNQGNICKAQAELVAAQREVERVQLALQDRLAEVFKLYSNAHQQTVQYQKDILPDAKSSLDLVQFGYKKGEFGYLELLTAQRTYTQVNLAYLQSLRALRRSSVEIEGLLLTGGLAAPGP